MIFINQVFSSNSFFHYSSGGTVLFIRIGTPAMDSIQELIEEFSSNLVNIIDDNLYIVLGNNVNNVNNVNDVNVNNVGNSVCNSVYRRDVDVVFLTSTSSVLRKPQACVTIVIFL